MSIYYIILEKNTNVVKIEIALKNKTREELMLKKVKENKKGFTLAELLIVVAIIAVLVAISIPIFTSQLEKARDAADAANLRSAYAEASAQLLTSASETDVTSDPVTITGKTAGIAGVDEIGGVKVTSDTVLNGAKAPQQITVTVHANGTAPTFTVTSGK